MDPLDPADAPRTAVLPPANGAAAPRGLRDEPAAAPAGAFALSDADLARFGTGRAVVVDGSLGAEALRVAAALRAREAWLTPAAIGRGDGWHVAPGVRGDRTVWLEPAAAPELGALWALFDAVGAALRERSWLGPLATEVQLALYPGDGATYARHRDAFAGGGRRRATAVWYANEGWSAADGGALRVFEPDGARDLAPVLDRLVLFDATRVEHAVLPCRAPRRAVTAWFLGPPAP